MTTDSSRASRASRAAIVRALLVAGALLAASALLAWLSPEHVAADTARRVLGVLMGAVVMISANAVPKTLAPLGAGRCDAATEQALRRFAGWSLALGGAAYALAWAVAPIAHANLLAASGLGAAVLVLVVRVVRARGARANG